MLQESLHSKRPLSNKLFIYFFILLTLFFISVLTVGLHEHNFTSTIVARRPPQVMTALNYCDEYFGSCWVTLVHSAPWCSCYTARTLHWEEVGVVGDLRGL